MELMSLTFASIFSLSSLVSYFLDSLFLVSLLEEDEEEEEEEDESERFFFVWEQSEH